MIRHSAIKNPYWCIFTRILMVICNRQHRQQSAKEHIAEINKNRIWRTVSSRLNSQVTTLRRNYTTTLLRPNSGIQQKRAKPSNQAISPFHEPRGTDLCLVALRPPREKKKKTIPRTADRGDASAPSQVSVWLTARLHEICSLLVRFIRQFGLGNMSTWHDTFGSTGLPRYSQVCL